MIHSLYVMRDEKPRREVEKIEANENLIRWMGEYKNLIFSICLRMTGDYFTAEDIAQETFLSAYMHMDKFDGNNEKAWLCRIAANKCTDYLRSAAAKAVPTAEDEMPTAAQSAYVAASEAANNPADIYEKMKRFISREGFAYLPASPRYLQLYNVGMDAYFNLIRGAKASGEYDFIIVDADNSFGNVKATLFSIADRAVIVSRSGPEENARLAVLHEILDSESNTGQVLYVRNFAEESFRESSENNFGSRRGEPALKKKNVHKPAGEEQETSAVIERTAELRSLADLSKIAGIRELAVRIISLPEVSD